MIGAAAVVAAVVAIAQPGGKHKRPASRTSRAQPPSRKATALGAAEPRHARRRRSHGPGSSACPASARVLDGVYHPERLTVLDPCRHVRGLVVRSRPEDDGDLHFDMRLEPRFRKLLRSGNFAQQGGALVVEFMPRDHGQLPRVVVGDQVSLIGAWVDDTQHDWSEFHPVWAVSINGGAWHRSGPRFGGSPAEDRSANALAGCRTQAHRCRGY